jgi:hypothetical protein
MEPSSRSIDQCLFVFLRPRLALALTGEPETSDPFVLDGRSYRDIGQGNMTGFYDWLRAPTGKLLGIRYLPLLDFEFPMHLVRHLDYIAEDDGALEIYFTADRRFDPESSKDQDFGGNWIFSSQEGDLVITFATEWLSDSDLESLRSYPVEWLSLSHGIGQGPDDDLGNTNGK